MNLTIAIWTSPTEAVETFVGSTQNFTNLSFSTSAMGGFGDASFSIRASGWNAVRWYREYLGFHVVIIDHLGRRVYEGSIEDAQADSEGVNITCLGYYATANELLHGVIYPIGIPATPTDIIIDTIEIANAKGGLWSSDTSMVQSVTHNIAPLDFSGGKKLLDAVTECVKFGNNGVIPVPMYVAVWDNRRVYFYEEPSLTGTPSWHIYKKDFSSGSGLSLSRSRSNIWNRIQVTYDDPDIGATFTDFAEDLDSQRLFRLREGTVNIGQSLPAVAEVIRDLSIKAYAQPEQQSGLGVNNRVYNYGGAPDYPYMLRAGSLIQVMDYDPSVAQLVGGSTGEDASIAFVSRTTYNADSNEVTLELGRKSAALDLFMARLGMGSSGSVS